MNTLGRWPSEECVHPRVFGEECASGFGLCDSSGFGVRRMFLHRVTEIYFVVFFSNVFCHYFWTSSLFYERGLSPLSHHRLGSFFFARSSQFCSWFSGSLMLRFSRFFASCRSAWLTQQQASVAPVSQLSTTSEEPPLSNECVCDKSEYEPSVHSSVTSFAKIEKCIDASE